MVLTGISPTGKGASPKARGCPLFLATLSEQQFGIRAYDAIVCVLCISLDGGILRPISVLYYSTVEKAEVSRRPHPNGYMPHRIAKLS